MRIKRFFFLVMVFTCLLGCSKSDSKQTVENDNSSSPPISKRDIKIKVANYNIRVATKGDEADGNGWDVRKGPIKDIIKGHDLDIVGMQEGNFQQMADLLSLLPNYKYVGYPYGGKDGTSHTASIFYKKDSLAIMDKGLFYYSETPNVKSIGWDATDLRICTWAKMKHKRTGRAFYFFTSHFYWQYQEAKHHSGQVMVDQIKDIVKDDLPIISTGDLNSGPTTLQVKDIETYLNDAYKITETPPTGPFNTTFHGGVFSGKPVYHTDYIFVSDKIKVLSYAVLTDGYTGNHYPSDHYPVMCVLLIKK